MLQAIFSAASGLKNQQLRLDTVANNVANVNTTGYKAARVDFKDALYTAMDHPMGGAEAANLLAGSGVLVSDTSTSFTGGTLASTGGSLDFALTGNGFFTVQDAFGQTLYTKNGSFGISVQDTGDYLVTGQGDYVLDDTGGRIVLPRDKTGLTVSESGVLSTGAGPAATLGIAEFPNPEGLEAAGGTRFQATEGSGQAVPAGETSVLQGRLEGSNVELSQELTLLIRSQRAYSMASRALQTADSMEGLANNMR